MFINLDFMYRTVRWLAAWLYKTQIPFSMEWYTEAEAVHTKYKRMRTKEELNWNSLDVVAPGETAFQTLYFFCRRFFLKVDFYWKIMMEFIIVQYQFMSKYFMIPTWWFCWLNGFYGFLFFFLLVLFFFVLQEKVHRNLNKKLEELLKVNICWKSVQIFGIVRVFYAILKFYGKEEGKKLY